MFTDYKNINKDLAKYINEKIFPEYSKNDKGHGLLHILEVIRRSFELKESLKLDYLDNNIIYTIASCHDNGKYIDHKTHEKIAAKLFYENNDFKMFFTDEQRKIIKEAIEDHRSSFEDEPRSDYGKLISSADRNSTIDIVFIRSFFVGQDRTPDLTVEEFLNFTLNRLKKRYSKENSENMFFEDKIYTQFLYDMRILLNNEKLFKQRYCEVNGINDTTKKIIDFEGCTDYKM